MKLIQQMSNLGNMFMSHPNKYDKSNKINNKTNERKTNLVSQKINDMSKNNKTSNNYEYLDTSQLQMLNLNENIQNILQKPVKHSLNLENVCNDVISSFKNTSTLKSLNKKTEENVKHCYESGSPNIVGTYIQPLNGKQNGMLIPNLMGQNVMGQNVMGQNVMGQNVMGQKMMGQNVMGQKMMDPNLMNPNLMNPNLMNPNLMNPNLMNQNLMNQNLMGPNILNNQQRLQNFGFPLSPTPPSPFFQPPNRSANMIPPTNNFIPINKNTNMYGLPSYLIPDAKPQKLSVTVIPNKHKDTLEKEAKQLKLLLDSSSQGIVNSTPDYQKILSSDLSYHNDKGSDFSFGKNDYLEHSEISSRTTQKKNVLYEDALETNYDSFITEQYNSNNYSNTSSISYLEQTNDDNINNKSPLKNKSIGYISPLKSSNGELENTNKKGLNSHHNDILYNSNDAKINSGNKNNVKSNKTTNGSIKQNSKEKIRKAIPIKKKKINDLPITIKQEPSTCFKNSKTYVNIRLGKPKKLYLTNISDPIDNKLKEWHNTHNSQVEWKKNRRGVYTFGKTEVVLSLVYDKIIVKKINGKYLKDNLLTVEKFVSLNELYELKREERDKLQAKEDELPHVF